MQKPIPHFRVLLLLSFCPVVQADYKDDIGYTRLLLEQGANTPQGGGVTVVQAEAVTGFPPVYMPDLTNPQFSTTTITDASDNNPPGYYSGHATGVGNLFYGDLSSIAPAIDSVDAYDASRWLGNDYLRSSTQTAPMIVPERIANHSWIGDSSDDALDLDIIKRVDWVIDHDEFIQVVGLTNSTSTNSPQLSASFNAIAAGVSDGIHGRSTVYLGAPYVAGRTRPDLVAPFSEVSNAAPVIAAAAALLVEHGHSMTSLSTDPLEQSTTNRSGNTIYNAERSEVVKAVLMAGADRVTLNSTNPDPATPQDITDYRAAPVNQSTNGLDIRFGAGQLNIYNSFHILDAGEQNSLQDENGAGGVIGTHGFDYDPRFGGHGNSNSLGTYSFSTDSNPVMLTAALVTNVEIDKIQDLLSPTGKVTLHDLDIRLFDITGGGYLLVAESVSSIENTENLRVYLDAGRNYQLEVRPKSIEARNRIDYALAWLMLADTDADGVHDDIDTDDDNDGLTDTDEAAYGTNPLLADSDGDEFNDNQEVIYGSDPLTGSDTPENNYVNNGDVNNDGKVDAADVLLVNRIILGELVPTSEQLVRTDMVPDNQITTSDLLRIQQIAIGL